MSGVRGLRYGPVALGAGCFGVLAALVVLRWGPLLSLDRHLSREQIGYGLRHRGYVSIWRTVSEVCAPIVFHLLGSVTAIVVALLRQARLAGWIFLVTFGYLLGVALKLAVRRRRPPSVLAHAGGFSFPSGHALSVTLAMVVLVALVRQWVRAWWPAVCAFAAVVVAATCWSRVALAVHFISDVAGGVVLGLVWAALLWQVLRPISCRNDRSAGGSLELDRHQGGCP